MLASARAVAENDQSSTISLDSSASDTSELSHGGLMQSLADERPDLVSHILRLLDPIDLVHVSLCSKFLNRIVERDDAAWRAMMDKNARLASYLNLPRCFTDQQKVTRVLCCRLCALLTGHTAGVCRLHMHCGNCIGWRRKRLNCAKCKAHSPTRPRSALCGTRCDVS